MCMCRCVLLLRFVRVMAQQFRLRYLNLFNDTPADMPQTRDQAVKAALAYICSPVDSQKSDLFHMPAIQHLKSDSEHAPLFQLLKIFAEDTLAEYNAFQSAHAGYMESVGVDAEQGLHTMRLLTLCSLASSASTVPYAKVSEALSVPVEEVEGWVVQAIELGLMEGRMNQLKQEMEVSVTTHRKFERDQWVELQQKLHAWRDTLPAIMSVVKSARASSGI